MAKGQLGGVLRHLRRLVGEARAGDQADGSLLQHFVRERDQTAFDALLKRHGPMVLGVCRRVLDHEQDAEDAFQATFLVLVRKAASVRKQASVGSWLFGVAYRTASEAKVRVARRRAHEKQAGALPRPDPADATVRRELRAALDEELRRLPEKYRAPLVLHYLEGKTKNEAAEQLGWTEGTVSGRLARARELLRRRLARRGVTLATAALASLFAPSATAAPGALFQSTLQAALAMAAGRAVTGLVSGEAAALAEGVVQAMFLTKLRIAALVLLVVTVLAAGAGAFARRLRADKPSVATAEENPADPESPAAGAEPAPQGDKPARNDEFGDALPEGALFRVGTVRLQHVNSIHHLAFSPDRKILASSCNDNTLCLWETATGKALRKFPLYWVHPFFVFSPDGATLATNGPEGTCFYETATGKQHGKLKDNFERFVFSPDGKVLNAFGYGRVSRWQVASGEKLSEWRVEQGHTLYALSPDGGLVVTARANAQVEGKEAKDHMIRLWETATGKKLHEWKVPDDKHQVYAVAFSPDGKVFAVGSGDKMVRVYETATGKELRQWQAQLKASRRRDASSWEFKGLAFSPDGKVLVTVDGGQMLRLWDWTAGKQLHEFEDVYGPVAFSGDGKTVAAAGEGHRIQLWEVITGRDLCPLEKHPGHLSSLTFSPDGRVLAVGSDAHRIRLFESATGKELRQLPGYQPYVFSADGKSLALLRWDDAKEDWAFGLHETATGREVVRFEGASGNDEPAGWSPDGKTLATVDARFMYHPVRFWDVATGKKLREFAGKGSVGVGASACSPDAKTAALQFDEGKTICLFDTATGKELHRLSGCGFYVKSHIVRTEEKSETKASGNWHVQPVFSPDGKVLLSGGDDDSLRLWDVASGKQLVRLDGKQFVADDPVFSPNGKLLALRDSRADLCVLEAVTGKVRRRLERKKRSEGLLDENCWAFSADSRVVAVAYNDDTLGLWEVATGGEIRSWRGHGQGRVSRMVFSPDGTRLATVGADGTALVWDATGSARSAVLSAKELERAWTDLADRDAARAYRAVWELVAAKQTVPFLQEWLRPVPSVDARRLGQLIHDLEDERFAVRDKASEELARLGELAELALRQALAGEPALDLRKRLGQLLEQCEDPARDPVRLRTLRALGVLEHLGTPEARQLVATLAKGAPEVRLTQEAKAALERLAKRAAVP